MKNGHEMFHHPGSSLRFPTKEGARARAATILIEPIWQQFAALLPEHRTDHQLGCHRSGIPLGAVSAPVNRHDSPLLVPTLEAAFEALGTLPEGASVHLDCGYNSRLTRERLAELGLRWEISRLQVDLSLYAAVEPATGEGFCLYLPGIDGGGLETFLDRLSEAYPDNHLLLVLDGAPSHRSKESTHPETVSLWSCLSTLPN